MAQKPKDGGTAYPVTDGTGKVSGGMSQRSLLAALSLNAAVRRHPDESPEFIAKTAVRYADELLKALDG